MSEKERCDFKDFNVVIFFLWQKDSHTLFEADYLYLILNLPIGNNNCLFLPSSCALVHPRGDT